MSILLVAASSSSVSEQEIDALASEIAQAHGVAAPGHIATTVLAPGKLRERLCELIMQDYDAQSLVDEGRLLTRLGLLPAGTCYEEVVYSVLLEQVVGLYDPRHDELLVLDGTPGAMMHEVLAHELTHAVQDASFDIGDRLARRPGEADLRAGLQAVCEGDALLMEQLLGGVLLPADTSAADIMAMMQLTTEPGDPFLKAPAFIRAALLFPYVHGLVLVRRAFEKGGMAAINDLFVNPPASTEQVMHPEKLHVDPPMKVGFTVPPTLSLLYRDAGDDVMGEYALRSWLETWIDPASAGTAAEGWGGDRYMLLWPVSSDVKASHQDRGVFILLTSWDRGLEQAETIHAEQFEQALGSYLESRYPGSVTVDMGGIEAVRTGGGELIVVERRSVQVLFVEGVVDDQGVDLADIVESIWASQGS